jgi:Glycine zipper 2TM domain
VIGGRRAAKAGASVQGSITQVVSGSKKVGGTPTLGVTFDSLVVASGASVPINAPLTQLGKSETGKDTAKIVGGAAAGAIIGHQVSHKNGAVVGGLLGGAAGTAAAHGTGGEVTLAAGQVVTVATQSSFEVRP